MTACTIVFTKLGDQQIRYKIVERRKKINAKNKVSHMTYLEGLFGLEEGSTCDSKTICFSKKFEAGSGW